MVFVIFPWSVFGLTSRKGSERTFAALHNEMNQMVVGRPKFPPLSEQWTANAVSEIRRLLVLGVLKNPKIEVTPCCAIGFTRHGVNIARPPSTGTLVEKIDLKPHWL